MKYALVNNVQSELLYENQQKLRDEYTYAVQQTTSMMNSNLNGHSCATACVIYHQPSKHKYKK